MKTDRNGQMGGNLSFELLLLRFHSTLFPPWLSDGFELLLHIYAKT
jgi:hypothetical protein